MKNEMRLLLDEMYTGLKDYFEILGWDVSTVREEGLEGASDKKIVEYAKEKNFVIVTEDQKPAELAELENLPHVLVTKRLLASMIDSEIREKYLEK
ncbi:hypothetical protein AKJ56_00575 [candidate division MSBL1 archaeon SCGC-AAA382N08]|uniref:DUF5615 domain-containing protein n=1 Tax=candidate division MSBL1 archaeon SCGC-AAA382N08 TaxID=1698285 RepID=A0A133VQI4_9EURY|nr:hypothetical protein AKJ56_00575 [candidate division MSBL1 archaeon SCGC-AAA382N08]